MRVLLVLAAMCSCALAQSGIQNAPSEDASTTAAPKKLPDKLEKPAAPETPKRTPEEVVGTFFEALKADKVDAAYDTLKTELGISERSPEEARKMREQTQKALDAYGPARSYEMVLEEKLGTHLMRRTYLLIGEVMPLRWKFYFYKPLDRWMLIDLRIDDSIPVWFDENAKATK
ncbi:MAG: hypothetical protein ACREKL_02620 [Chthoniobacterales bacterium]